MPTALREIALSYSEGVSNRVMRAWPPRSSSKVRMGGMRLLNGERGFDEMLDMMGSMFGDEEYNRLLYGFLNM